MNAVETGSANAPAPTTPTRSSGANASLLYLIKQVELASRARLDELVAPHGITTGQYTALTVLERHPGMTAAQLARHSFVRAQTMAQMVGYLEERRFIRRERDRDIRRQNLIYLTPDAQSMLAELAVGVAAIERDMLAALSAAEVGGLRDALRKCRIALDPAGSR